MLVAAALVPDTALLVPGAAGAADVLGDLRTAALDAVRAVADTAPSVVVVAPGRRGRTLTGRVRASLGVVGVPEGLLGWPVPERRAEPVRGVRADRSTPSTGTAVALHLLAQAGWDGALSVLETGPDEPMSSAGYTAPAPGDHGGDAAAPGRPGDRWRRVGAGLGAGRDVGLVVVGSGSGRHGPDGPLADDARAPVHDARLVEDLSHAGPAARARLAADDPVLAAELAVTGWAPWQVLVGAADEAAAGGADVDGRLLAAGTPYGAQHLVAMWTVTR